MSNLLTNIRRPDITFNRDGRIHITARVASLLGLQPGDSINIDADAGEYLLHAIHNNLFPGSCRAQCRPQRPGSRHLYVNSASLSRALLRACGISAPRASFAVGQAITRNSKTYLPIITRQPL